MKSRTRWRRIRSRDRRCSARSYLNLFGGALLRAGRLDEAARALEEARAVAAATRQYAYAAEQRRLDAEILLLRGDSVEAEAAFRDAIGIASRQSAHWLELRAARGLAQLFVVAGRTEDARGILQPVLDGLTEGHDTADYRLGAGLLASL